jgi:predicted phosphohydrolase
VSLFAIADLHLSFGGNMPMNIFKGWENHVRRLRENWNGIVGESDTVVIAGDISWGKSLETVLPDLEFISRELRGRKIILKGNHDYWWASLSKMNRFLAENNLNNISFLHNNAFIVENTVVCGTRGWFNEANDKHCEKLQKREETRLELSAKQALEISGGGIESGGLEVCAFLHYPPVYGGFENHNIIDVLRRYGIKRCFYGHLHGTAHKNAVTGTHYGIEFSLISADFVSFTPLQV